LKDSITKTEDGSIEVHGTYLLHSLLTTSASRSPEKIAVLSGGRSLTYATLDTLSDRLAGVLLDQSIEKGDRVGIYVPMSLASVVGLFAVLKAGACYVPLDPTAPTQRLARIISDSKLTLILSNSQKLAEIQSTISSGCPVNRVVLVDCDLSQKLPKTRVPLPGSTEVIGWNEVVGHPPLPEMKKPAIETDTAYILYTSGSTGMPKGVMISHRNSLSFVNWAAECARLTKDDRVAWHAPLHFDLSIFSIFSSCLAGATIVLVPEGTSTFPSQLAKLVESERITVWYSVPSVLTLMVLYGNLPAYDLSSLKTVIFAGEVFPLKYLQRLMTTLPWARCLNWYGPTETNVCTWYEVPHLEPDLTKPIPIGKACANTEVFAVTNEGRKLVAPGESGELYVRGPSVMQGYWGDPDKTAKSVLTNPFSSDSSDRVYKTGDTVTLDVDGNYLYLGRKDGMIKTRGYRVELGEIESVLYGHSGVKEVVVLPIPDELIGNRLRAIICRYESVTLTKDEVLRFCGERLPRYMVPDVVEFRETIPKTSTGKTDRVALAQSPTQPGGDDLAR